MSTATHSRSFKLYERQPTGGLQITDRDIEFLGRLERRRVMNSSHVIALYGREFAYQRLKRLFHHGYIERLTCYRKERLPRGGGSLPIPFAITNRARALLHAPLYPTRDWAERNRLLKVSSIPHPVAVADVDVFFSLAAERCPEYQFHEQSSSVSLLAPGRESAIIPDLTIVQLREQNSNVMLFCEIDLNSEPNSRRSGSELSNLRSKDEGYLSYLRSGLLHYEFGTKGARVLKLVTGGEKKKQNVAETSFKVCNGVGVDRFLVARLDDARDHGVLAPIWINAAGEQRSLL